MYENRSVSQRSADEVADFASSVAGTLGELWPDAVAASAGDLRALHAVAAEQGWFELGPEKALDFLVAAVRELGRRACPLPLADAYVATQVLVDFVLAASRQEPPQ